MQLENIRDIPLVSISCITFNHVLYIKECLDGFLMQKTDFCFEIVIHDDASTDGTADIIREYEKKYPSIIKPIYQRENQYVKGVRPTWEFNAPRWKGKYIALCEGDDYWTDPLKLQKQVDFLEKNESFGGCFHITERLNVSLKLKSLINVPLNTISTHDLIRHKGGGIFDTCSLLFKRKILDRSAAWFDFMPFDQTLYLLISLNGPIGKINSVMAVYRTNQPNSWTTTQSNDLNERLKFNLSEMRMWLIFYRTEDSRFKLLVIRQICKVLFLYTYNLFLFAVKKVIGDKYDSIKNILKR